MRSNAAWLHRLEAEFEEDYYEEAIIPPSKVVEDEDELEELVREVYQPRVVKSIEDLCKVGQEAAAKPVSKKELKAKQSGRKKPSDDEWAEKCRIAYWYLEEFLYPKFREELYGQYCDDVEKLVTAACERAAVIIEVNNLPKVTDDDFFQLFPPKTPKANPEFDIPDHLKDEFDRYCQRHPISSIIGIFERRRKFLNKSKKKRKKLYSKKRLRRMYDPLFAKSVPDVKGMMKNIKRISHENEERCKELKRFLNNLNGSVGIDPDVLAKFKANTDRIMRHSKERMRERMGEKKFREYYNPVYFDVDGPDGSIESYLDDPDHNVPWYK